MQENPSGGRVYAWSRIPLFKILLFSINSRRRFWVLCCICWLFFYERSFPSLMCFLSSHDSTLPSALKLQCFLLNPAKFHTLKENCLSTAVALHTYSSYGTFCVFSFIIYCTLLGWTHSQYVCVLCTTKSCRKIMPKEDDEENQLFQQQDQEKT